MKAVLDHIGIAIRDLPAALAFYRDALGLEVEAAEEIASQRVRAHFVPVGESSLELLEATAPDSPIARYLETRGPGLHHITLRVDDIHAALAQLVVRGARTMLIDAGLGDKETDKFRDIYGVERARNLDHTLAEAGLTPEDIDIVLATHLHFDHAGGFTRRDASGRVHPRFPRAQYIIRRGEWEDATHPHERNRASYLFDNYVPLADAGVLQLVDDDRTIMPGVRVRRTGGHTMHHQMAVIESGGKTAVFMADLMPTTAHLGEAWIMGYDLYPMDTLAAKKAFLKEAVERDLLVFFEHDPTIKAGRIEEHNGKRTVMPH